MLFEYLPFVMYPIIYVFLPFFIKDVSGEYYNKCNTLEVILKDQEDCTYNPDQYLTVVSIFFVVTKTLLTSKLFLQLFLI